MPEHFTSDFAARSTLNGSTFGQRREDIFKKLKNCADQVKLNYSDKKELATEKDEIVAELCDALEDTFSYGLRQQLNIVLTAASLFQNMQEIVTGGSSAPSSNDITFWDFCQAQLTPHERERYEQLKHIWTKVGRGKAFLRATLNENSLQRYVLTWLDSEADLQKYYTPWSLLLNDEAVKELPKIIDNLKNVLFALTIDCPELNVTKRSTTFLPHMQPKAEPIIFAPRPVPVSSVKPTRNGATVAVERPIAAASSTEDLISSLNINAAPQFEASEMNVAEQPRFEPIVGIYTTPVDPIEPELEFLKQPLPDYRPEEDLNGSMYYSVEGEHCEDKSDNSSQYSKSSSSANCSSNQAALEEQVRKLTERCSLLETRVAQLSRDNRQMLRRLTQQFNESGIDPSSSLCNNFLITIPHVKLQKTQRGGGSYYVYEIHITMRQRLEHWSLYRRYSDFYKLHKTLLRTHSAVSVVDFPPKKHFGNKNLVFVEERRQQLQIYLLNIVETLPQVECCKSKAELQKVFPFLRER